MKFLYRYFRLRIVTLFCLLAGCAVLPCFVACSDKGDGEAEDKPFAAIVSQSFVFDEADPANNRILVESNTAWEVMWTPADAEVIVSPVSGSGSGSFAIVDMPQGMTIEVSVRTMKGESNSIAVTRGLSSEDYTLVVTPLAVQFSATDPAANVITVKSNTTWTAVPSNPGLKISTAAGSGDGTITVTDMAAGQNYTLTVTAGAGDQALTQDVAVTRLPDVLTETVFNLDFGTTTSEVWANQATTWQTHVGTGASTVIYAVNNIRIREDGYGTAGRYTGASGRAYAKMFYEGSTDYFEVQDITLPTSEKNFTLTFGALFPESDVLLSVRGDDSSWKTLVYTGADAYNTWTKVTVGFTLKRAVDKLSIRLTPNGTVSGRAFGLNFDDIVLTTGGGGQLVDVGVSNDRWAELPSNWVQPTKTAAVVSGDYAFYTHWTQTVQTRKTVRNYSYCYDTRRHNPLWVAYPLHTCYSEGGFGRTSPDPWSPDPALDASVQSKIYRSDGPDGVDDYQFWTANTIATLGRPGLWSKGHLCMSRERGGAGQQINMQTFHPTNIAPQPNANAGTFSEIWSYAESLFSGTNNYKDTAFTADDGPQNINIVPDTLYIVAGCYYENDDLKEYDASNFGDIGPKAKLCVMPTAQWKIALRTRSGHTGKKISECAPGELQSIGFWIDTFTTSTAGSGELAAFAVPVSFIEGKMGMKFFPDVEDSVKEQVVPADWGF